MVLKAYKQDDKYFLEKRKEGFDKSKFEIVGNPTITTDGIASGFSNTDFIKTQQFSFKDKDKWVILSPYWKVTETVTNILIPLSWGSDATGSINFSLRQNKSLGMNYNNNNGVGATIIVGNIIELNTFYQCKWDYDNGIIVLSYRKYNGNWVEIKRSAVSACSSTDVISIGFGNPTVVFDLKAVSAEADGKEIFNGQIDKYYALQV